MGEETKQQAIYEFLKWREVQRKRHRVMTVGEYYAWSKAVMFFHLLLKPMRFLAD